MTRNLRGQVTNVLNTAGLNLTYTYNNQGLVTNVSSSAGTVFAAVYDAYDRPLYVTDANGVTITNAFDNVGRLTDRWNSFGKVLHNDYTAQGVYQRYDALNHYTYYGYDPAGRLNAVTNANQEITEFGYNPLGQITALEDGNGHITAWTYDDQGRQITKTDGNNVLIETNGYNANGWLTSHWTPAKGLTHYTNDPNGNLVGITYNTGTPVTAVYDALNRLTTLNDAVGTSAFTYANFGAFSSALETEDGPWASDTITYNYTNRLQQTLSLAQPTGSWAQNYGYDGLQRLHTLTSTAGTFAYAYNGAGSQINTLTLPGTGNSITKTYDAAGQLLTTALAHSSTVLDGYTYTNDLDGNRIAVTRADNAYVSYGYDNIGQLTSAQGMEPDGVTPRGNENFGYGYDPAGNLLLRTNNTLLQTFTTDNANQLRGVTRNNDLLTVAGSMTVSNTFTINGQGASIYHDLTFAVTNGVTIANGLNVLTAVAVSNNVPMTNKTVEFLPTTVTIANDVNGNLISDGLHGYDYDCANQLTRITVTNILKAEFDYDGFGRKRIRREFTWQTNSWLETNEIHYVYDGMLVIQERASNNTPLVTYTRGVDMSVTMQDAGGIGGILARTDANGNSAFYHADGNGNITMLVSNNGVVLAKYLYDSFGNTLGMWGALATANAYRFSSKEYEPYAGLYYYGYRYYQPSLQRWLNRDPMQEAGGINLYQMVGNNSLRYVDLFGFGAEEFFDGVDRWLEAEQFSGGNLVSMEATGIARIGGKVAKPIAMAGEAAIDAGKAFLQAAKDFKKARDAAKATEKLLKEKKCLGAKRGPKTDPTAPHNAKIKAEGDRLKAEDNTILAGGGCKPEKVVPTPGGNKGSRRPDILYETPDGTTKGLNVGKAKADGAPIKREQQALDDLNNAGLPTDFIPYD